MHTEAFITGDLLRWARERADLTPEAIAKSLKVSPSVYLDWEDEEKRPTFRKAQAAARRLGIPFGYLYLKQRPDERLGLPDLRSADDQPPTKPSIDLIDTVEGAMRKQAWYREYADADGAEPLPFVGSFRASAHYSDIAADMRATLGLTEEFHRDASNWEDFLRRLIRRAEETGILVFRSGVVGADNRRPLDRNEFKGFVISDAVAPAIFLNSKDWKTSQIFTLGHELAHIWISESGVSNPDLERSSAQQANVIERLCNRVAAEALAPEASIRHRWNIRSSVESNVSGLATQYRVSQIVLLRQARDTRIVTEEEFFEDYERQSAERNRRRDRGSGTGDGGDFYATLFARSSQTLTSALMDAVSEGTVPALFAASMLGVKHSTLDRIALKTEIQGA